MPADAGEDASEESDIDWEDADENDHGNNTVHDGDNIATRLPSLPSEGVTITFSSASNTPSEEKGLAGNHEYQALNKEETTSKNRKRSTVRVLKNIPYHTEQLILNERRSHLLCCLSHSLRCSSLCSVGQSQNHQSSQTIDNDKEEASLLLNTACSLVPAEFHINGNQTPKEADSSSTNCIIPTNEQLHNFSEWFFQFANPGERCRIAMQRNVAQGAAGAARSPARKRGRTSTAVDCNPSKSKKGGNVSGGNEHGCETHPIELLSNNILSTNSLITRLMYLSPYYDNDPQLFLNSGIDFIRLVESITPLEKALLFLAMARYVTFSFALIYVIQLVSNVIKSFLDRWVGEHVLCLL